MSPAIILGAITLIPVLLLMVFRINAALVFLSLCLGNVLVQFTAKDLASITSAFSAQAPGVIGQSSTVNLVLLLFPVAITMLIMVKTIRGHGKLLINLLPAAAVGVLGALLVVPLLPGGISHNLMSSPIWAQGHAAQAYVVGLGAVVSLLSLLMQRPKPSHDGKHGKH